MTAPRRGRIGRVVLASSSVFCLALLTTLVAIRWLRYASWTTAPAIDAVFRELMVPVVQAFVWPWVSTTVKQPMLVFAAVVLVVGLHRRLAGLLVTRADGVWRLTPLAIAVVLGGAVWVHYGFDLNATMARVCALSVPLFWLAGRIDGAAAAARVVLAAAWAALAAWALITAGDWTDCVAIVAWLAALFVLHRHLRPRVGGRELALACLLLVVPVNLLPALLPLAAPLHGGTFIAAGVGYDFCEVPGRGTIYASIPTCDSVQTSWEACRDGRIVEYDLRTMRPVAEHRHLRSPRFAGRIELIECLEDEVQVSIQGAILDGRRIRHAALAFQASNPDRFDPMVAGEGMGVTVAWDRRHDALFYSGEFTHRILRRDRRTGRVDEVGGDALARRWIHPLALEPFTGSTFLYTESIHPGRDRLYVAEWLQGRYAWAIDLTTLQAVRRYDVGSGGALGITVDAERDRLLVSSVWGVEVFDLATDTLIARRRIGFANRPVVVDAPRNRLYLGSTVAGKIYVLDRDTFETIDQIPIGMGTRFAHLSADGRRLFATSAAAHFYWDLDALAERR